MGPSSFLSIIAIVTNGTMLNFNCGNNGHGLKTLRVNRPQGRFLIYQVGRYKNTRSFNKSITFNCLSFMFYYLQV